MPFKKSSKRMKKKPNDDDENPLETLWKKVFKCINKRLGWKLGAILIAMLYSGIFRLIMRIIHLFLKIDTEGAREYVCCQDDPEGMASVHGMWMDSLYCNSLFVHRLKGNRL